MLCTLFTSSSTKATVIHVSLITVFMMTARPGRPTSTTPIFANIVYVTPEVTIGHRATQRRATWHLIRVGTVHVRRSLHTTDLREAKAKAMTAYTMWLNDPNSDWLSAGGITNHHVSFKRCAEEWHATQRQDVSYKDDVIRKFLLPFFHVERDVTNIATVSAALIADYKLWRRTFWLNAPANPAEAAARRASMRISAKQMETLEEPSLNTLNREYPTLRQILRYAEQRDYIPRGYAPAVPPESSTANPRPAFLGGDFETLRKRSDKWVEEAQDDETRYKRHLLADWIYINRYTGLRLPHEAELLTWNEIALNNAMLYVSGDTKTGRREVPLRDEARTRLAALKARRQAYCTAHGQTFSEAERVFVLENGAAYGDLPNLFRKLVQLCAFPQRSGQLPYTPYSLRHTYATFTLAEGKDYPWLEEVMGTSMKMLREHYKQGTIEQTRRYLEEAGQIQQQGNGVVINHDAAALRLIHLDSLPADHPHRQPLTLVPVKR